MQKLVKENEGFFILKLVASEIHSHFVSMNKFRSDENAELVKENEGFFVLKLVASEIHFLRVGARWLRDSLHSYGSIFCDRPPPKGDQFFFRGC